MMLIVLVSLLSFEVFRDTWVGKNFKAIQRTKLSSSSYSLTILFRVLVEECGFYIRNEIILFFVVIELICTHNCITDTELSALDGSPKKCIRVT